MRFAVVGAGAIGGWLTAQLVQAGEDVTLVARGATLKVIQARGLRVRASGGDAVVRPASTDELARIHGVDVVLLAVKAHALRELAAPVAAALSPAACVVSLQNGIPWWYFDGRPGPLAGTHLRSVDPGGVIAGNLPYERVVGSVVYPAVRVVEPGVVEHLEANRISIGEPAGGESARCRAISAVLAHAGVRCPVRADLRKELWLKLVGNAVLNPLSALTGASLAAIAADPPVSQVAVRAMEEAVAVAAAVDVHLDRTVRQRLQAAADVGEHKTSMLQDLEAGKPLELEPLTGAVIEIGQLTGVATPTLETLFACTRLLAEARACAR